MACQSQVLAFLRHLPPPEQRVQQCIHQRARGMGRHALPPLLHRHTRCQRVAAMKSRQQLLLDCGRHGRDRMGAQDRHAGAAPCLQIRRVALQRLQHRLR